MQINIVEAQPKLPDLINLVSSSHKPIVIKGKKSNAVLLSEDDWEAIQETLYLMSIPMMRESIQEGLNTPNEACKEIKVKSTINSNPESLLELKGGLENSITFVGDPVQIQKRLRDEWR